MNERPDQSTKPTRFAAWAALNEDGVPIAASIRRTKEECCHDSSISDPVRVIIAVPGEERMVWQVAS